MDKDRVKTVPIPLRLSKNDRDRRGLPIPYIVYRDKDGQPHFTVDDTKAVNWALSQKLCGLCGEPLQLGQMWLIGGPISSFLEDGMFATPPAHEECARYAVQVCPYIAASNYSNLIEAKTLKPQAIHDALGVHIDQIKPRRPLFFALTCTSQIKLIDAQDGSGRIHILPHRPWTQVEFWQNGSRIAQWQAQKLAEASEYPPRQLKWWPV